MCARRPDGVVHGVGPVVLQDVGPDQEGARSGDPEANYRETLASRYWPTSRSRKCCRISPLYRMEVCFTIQVYLPNAGERLHRNLSSVTVWFSNF